MICIIAYIESPIAYIESPIGRRGYLILGRDVQSSLNFISNYLHIMQFPVYTSKCIHYAMLSILQIFFALQLQGGTDFLLNNIELKIQRGVIVHGVILQHEVGFRENKQEN